MLAYVGAVLYAVLGWGVLVYVAYKYYIFLCLRWGVEWGPWLEPLARRAAVLSSVPLVGVALLIGFGLLGEDRNPSEFGLFAGFASMAGLTLYQAWALSAQYRAETAGSDRNRGSVRSVEGDKDDTE